MKTRSKNPKKVATVGASRPRSSGRRVVTTTPVNVVATPRITTNFAEVFALSPAKAQALVQTTISAKKPLRERAVESSALVHWASSSTNAQHRRTVVKAFTKAKLPLMLVQHMAELPREQAAVFMKDYLAAGGKLSTVMEWVRIAGSVMRRRRLNAAGPTRKVRATARRTRGLFDDIVDWVSDTVEDIGEAVVDAVDSLVDAVVSAGKTLAQAVAEAASWTVAQLTDLVEALLDAGRSVAAILTAAAAKSLDLLKKYVEAMINAGRSIGEILLWAAGKVAATVNAVVAKLLQLGKTILSIIQAVVTAGANSLLAIIKALLAAGKTAANILAAIATQALSIIQPVINALLAAGQTIAKLLIEAAKLTAAACRNIVQALLNLGRTLTQLLVAAAGAVGNTLRVILQTLFALGRSLAQILVAIAGQAINVVKAVLNALFALGRTLAEIVIAAASQAVAITTGIFKALVALGKKVADFLIALAGRAVSALRTALQALLAMGITLANIIKDIVLSVAEGFRRGFFEGLIALGKTPLLILKAAAEISASVLLLAFAVVIELFGGHRPLDATERREAERIFGSSINLKQVKIATSSLPADVINYINGGRAFTTMRIINFGSGATVEMRTLIHELTHVWQGVQTGPLYMVRALEAQIGAGVDSLFHTGEYNDAAAYAVTDEALQKHGGNFSKFNPEQQASIVDEYWSRRFNSTPAGDVSLLEPYARQVFTPLLSRSTRSTTKAAKPRLIMGQKGRLVSV